MKRKLPLGLICALALVSCVGPKNISDENGANSQIAKNLVTTQEYVVPVKEGYTTIVTYNGQRLAVTSDPITILIPKEAASSITKANDEPKLFVYFEEGVTKIPTSTLWQTIAFEDSKAGDWKARALLIPGSVTRSKVTTSKMVFSTRPLAKRSSVKERILKLTFSPGLA